MRYDFLPAPALELGEALRLLGAWQMPSPSARVGYGIRGDIFAMAGAAGMDLDLYPYEIAENLCAFLKENIAPEYDGWMFSPIDNGSRNHDAIEYEGIFIQESVFRFDWDATASFKLPPHQEKWNEWLTTAAELCKMEDPTFEHLTSCILS